MNEIEQIYAIITAQNERINLRVFADRNNAAEFADRKEENPNLTVSRKIINLPADLEEEDSIEHIQEFLDVQDSE